MTEKMINFSIPEATLRELKKLSEVMARSDINILKRNWNDLYYCIKVILKAAGMINTLNEFVWPMEGKITSHYGERRPRKDGTHYYHGGLDIAGPSGVNTQVVAAAGGTVTHAGWNSYGYGNMIDIQHKNGLITRYAHLHNMFVSKGDMVEAGRLIALAGDTGHSRGIHLHFEVRRNGKTANPIDFLPPR